MYKITAHAARQRMPSLRTGNRRRSVPILVMSDGSALKLKPGKPVVVSDEVYHRNEALIKELSHCMDIVQVGTTPVPVTVTEPILVETTVEVSEPTPVEVSEPTPVEVSEPTPVEVSEPIEKPAPKKRATRAKKEVPVDVSSEEVPKPKRRRRKSTKKAT